VNYYQFTGTLSFLQEILGSNLAGVPIIRPSKDASVIAHILAAARIDSKSVKMGAYGAFIAAPISHYLVGTLQKMFAGKTSASARVAQILASNIFVAPIQTIGDLLVSCLGARYILRQTSSLSYSVFGVHGCH
jgi:hypothetical protein